MRTHLEKPAIEDGHNILTFPSGAGSDLRNDLVRCEQVRRLGVERMSAIGTMACSISHDMRHSLSAIYANAEFLERHDLCPSTRRDLLLEIQDAVHRMTERIDSLLRFGTGGRDAQLTPASVSVVLEKAVAAVKLHPDVRDISISVGRIAPVEADINPRSLESAIYNLLLNACQAATGSNRVPEVWVSVTEADEQICITIYDNGPGIPTSIRSTLFNPFVTAGKPSGTGLGLTLARLVAEEHGGSVCLVESNPGRTAFKLSLGKNSSCSREKLKNT